MPKKKKKSKASDMFLETGQYNTLDAIESYKQVKDLEERLKQMACSVALLHGKKGCRDAVKIAEKTLLVWARKHRKEGILPSIFIQSAALVAGFHVNSMVEYMETQMPEVKQLLKEQNLEKAKKSKIDEIGMMFR